MSFYDVVMLVVIGGAVWFGFWKGLAWQIASVAAVCISYIVAVNFREPVSRFIQAEEPWNRIGAMLVLFLGTSIVIWIMYGRVKGSIKRLELKGFDRQAGALLGAVKGALLAMVITIFSVSLLGASARNAIHTSKFGPYVIRGIDAVSGIVPAEIAQYVHPHVENFQEQIGQGEFVNQPNGGVFPNVANPLPGLPSGTNQYQVNGGIQQNPNQLPAAQSGYQGQWQWQAPQQQPQQTYNQQYNPQYNQPNTQPNNNWNQGYTNQTPANTQGGSYYGNNGFQTRPATQPTTQQQPGSSPFNGASQELFSGARQVFGEAVGEAAKRAFENGVPR